MRPSDAGLQSTSTMAGGLRPVKEKKKKGKAEKHNSNKSVAQVTEQIEEEQKKQEQQLLLGSRGSTRYFNPTIVICCGRLVDSPIFAGLTAVLTCYALIADDLRVMYTNAPSDPYFDIWTAVAFLVFSIECSCSCIGKRDYFGGFFFTLDFVSTVTLVLDLTFVNDALLQGDEEDMEDLKSSRTARIGARAARIVRVLRLLRLLKLWKTFSEAYERRQEKKRAKEKKDDDWDDDQDEVEDDMVKLHKESEVGKKLQELTTRRIVILVLTMMMGLPMLQLEAIDKLPNTAAYGADVVNMAMMKMLKNDTVSSRETYERAMIQYVYYHNWFARKTGCGDRMCPASYFNTVFWIGIVGLDEAGVKDAANRSHLSLSSIQKFDKITAKRGGDTLFDFGYVPPSMERLLSSRWNQECRIDATKLRQGLSLLVDESHKVFCPEDLRKAERAKYTSKLVQLEDLKAWHLSFYVDKRPFIHEESMFNLMITLFICLVLTSSSMLISGDMNSMMMAPLESMMLKVQMVRINPMLATKLGEDAFNREQREKHKNAQQKHSKLNLLKRKVCCQREEKTEENMETKMLENTIIKLGTLLALGFGAAGANVISRSMKATASESAVMIPGGRISCIIGKAHIRDFDVITMSLQKRVMTFVNQVAEIVHGIVDDFGGAPNRTDSDAFLLIWMIEGLEPKDITRLADMSIVSFAHIFSAIHTSRILAEYRKHPRLQYRIKNYRVNIDMGLHSGWAIEGAVGSEFKIDASYLSPNVSIAETIQDTCKIYGVSVMATGDLLNLCSRDISEKCRMVDRLIVKGSKEPLELYCVDLSYRFLKVDGPRSPKIPFFSSRARYRCKHVLDLGKQRKWEEDVQLVEYFSGSLAVNAARMPFTREFMEIFKMGFLNYTEGEWHTAKRILVNTQQMLGFPDGPSSALLRFMSSAPFHFSAPDGWCGVHSLETMVEAHNGQTINLKRESIRGSGGSPRPPSKEGMTMPEAPPPLAPEPAKPSGGQAGSSLRNAAAA